MQTFLPFADFKQSARSLDMARLGKQRLETLQIMRVICGSRTNKGEFYRGWHDHPAVNQWRGYEYWLMQYQFDICSEWQQRPRKNGVAAPDTCYYKTVTAYLEALEDPANPIVSNLALPPWLGREDIHESHRSRLIAKDSLYYCPQFGSITREGLDYVWPSQEEEA